VNAAALGVNFVAAERFRTSVSIHCGPPIHSSEYVEAYRENKARAIQSLTDELRKRLETMVVQFPHPALDDDYEAALELSRSVAGDRSTGLTHSGTSLALARRTVRNVDPEDRSIPDFVDQLKLRGVTVEQLVAAGRGVDFPLLSLPAAFLILPQLPLWCVAEIIARLGTTTTEFYSPVRFAAIAVGTLLYLPLLFFLSWPLRLYLLSSICLTGWALQQLEELQLWWGARRAKRVAADEYVELLRMQRELVQ